MHASERTRLTSRACIVLWLSLLAVVGFWWTQTRGLISSNDGSHVALGRALASGRVTLERDVGLTLWVDVARVGERAYSDRPPGTAFAALPALLIARPFDARFEAWSRDRLREARDATPQEVLFVRPASSRFIDTYGARRIRVDEPTVDLLALQGTAWFIGLHGVLVGALGLILVWRTLSSKGASTAARFFAIVTLGLASLFGPYSTALFSHVTSGVALMLAWVASEGLRDRRGSEGLARRAAVAAGLALGWAVISDYALVLVALGLLVLGCRPRDWPWMLLGALPVALAAATYHHAAFGAWWRIGYDFQETFAFARQRGATFSGNPWAGAWILWGTGRGAGVLAQAPVMVLGILGLVRGDLRRFAGAFVPWLVLLAFHRTPAGGAGDDHRYLVPVMPVLACGLGVLWDRLARLPSALAMVCRIAVVALGLVSVALTWQHFWSWRGA